MLFIDSKAFVFSNINIRVYEAHSFHDFLNIHLTVTLGGQKRRCPEVKVHPYACAGCVCFSFNQ